MKEILLITISGPDRPGLNAALMKTLAGFDAKILDVGQAVIHDTLSLGLLVELPDPGRDLPALKDNLLRAHADVQIRFSPITEQSYRQWVQGQGRPRYIVTLLARKISASQLAQIADVVARHRLTIDAITRLSGRIPLGDLPALSKACVEFSLRGELDDSSHFRAELLELAGTMEADIAFQEDDMYRRNRRLVAFDMDSTLIDAEVIDLLAIAAGVGDEVAAITGAAMRGEIDFSDSLRRRVALLAGLKQSVLEETARTLRLTEGAVQLLATLRSLGYKTAILSGGFRYFGECLQQRLGIDYVYANELEIVDGKLTGKVVGDIVDGARKASLLRKIAAREGIALEQVISVGDGANDLPMLSIAGLGIAFRARPLVQRTARQSISTLGLDGILYLLGISDRERAQD